MHICLVYSSYEGTNSPFERWDPMADPSHYVDSSRHTFAKRYIRKSCERDDIDRIVAEGFELYMNFMWGQLNDNVSGVEATRYLEEKGVTVILSPSDFIAKTKVDFRNHAAVPGSGFRVPRDTPGRYPKILKYADGMASMGMDSGSVCFTEDAVARKQALLEKAEPSREAVVQDFIRGMECTAIVLEVGDDVVALAPVEWVFAGKDIPEDEKWLKQGNKFEDLAGGSIRHRFIPPGDARDSICEQAVAAFKGIGMQGKGGWGRLDARVETETGLVYSLEMNHMPVVFYPPDCGISDDFIVSETYPGGHAAFFDVLIHTKLRQMGKSRKPLESAGAGPVTVPLLAGPSEGLGEMRVRGNTIESVYDSCVDAYEGVVRKTELRRWQLDLFGRYDHGGVTLDLGCGPGVVGMLIGQTAPDAARGARQPPANILIHGVDLSKGMLSAPWCERYYATVQQGAIQEVIMDPSAVFMRHQPGDGNGSNTSASSPSPARRGVLGGPMVDHITCFGALHFLTGVEFNAVLSRMFALARRSVTFDVDDVSPKYMERVVAALGEGLRNHNHTAAYRRFGTPPGWAKVCEEEGLVYHSPTFGLDVRGVMVRFERSD